MWFRKDDFQQRLTGCILDKLECHTIQFINDHAAFEKSVR